MLKCCISARTTNLEHTGGLFPGTYKGPVVRCIHDYPFPPAMVTILRRSPATHRIERHNFECFSMISSHVGQQSSSPIPTSSDNCPEHKLKQAPQKSTGNRPTKTTKAHPPGPAHPSTAPPPSQPQPDSPLPPPSPSAPLSPQPPSS